MSMHRKSTYQGLLSNPVSCKRGKETLPCAHATKGSHPPHILGPCSDSEPTRLEVQLVLGLIMQAIHRKYLSIRSVSKCCWHTNQTHLFLFSCWWLIIFFVGLVLLCIGSLKLGAENLFSGFNPISGPTCILKIFELVVWM